MYNLLYSDQVLNKDILKLSAPIKSLIRLTIERKLLSDPVKFGKPLRYTHKGCRTLRIGDYRVIYQIAGKTVKILIIQHRKDCYN